MTDIAEFLLARIAETERRGRSYRLKPNAPGLGETWHDGDPDAPHGWWNYRTDAQRAVTAEEWDAWAEACTEPVVDPLVLADCAAKRAVVAYAGEHPLRSHNHGRGALDMQALTLAVVLRHLATAYADHPDYDETWRPSA